MIKYYVYKTTNTVNNKIYVGAHGSDDIQNDSYLGSGQLLIMAIKKYGKQKFMRQILYQYQTSVEAFHMEAQIVDQDFIKRSDTYNLKLGGEGGQGGRIPVMDKEGNIFSVLLNDPRYLSGQLVHNTTGMMPAKDYHGNIHHISIDDPRRKFGELVGLAKGMMPVKDKDGNCFLVDRGDPRIESGQLVHILTDMISVKDQNGNTFSVHKSDQRWLSGQLVGATKGKKYPSHHQVGKRNSQYGTIWITNQIQSKKIKKDEPIPEGWRRGRVIRK